MDIILPSSKYKSIYLPEYQETSSDNESILYFEKENQIVLMNETSTCIWKFIANCIKENNNNTSDDNITVDMILKHLYRCFDIEASYDNDIENDIVDIIEEFVNNKMIGYNND